MPIPLPSLPIDNTQICLTIPNSSEWRQLYMGSMLIMTQWWYWDVENAEEAEDIVQRVMECIAITGSDYEGCIDMDCQTIIDCINSTPELQQLISQLSNRSGIDDGTGEQSNNLNRDFFDGNVGCNNDNIFGMTLQMTDFFNRLSEDILEVIVIGFANTARMGDIIEAIPVVGSLPFDDILQFIEAMAVQVNNAYQGAYDAQIREDIACDLFCIAQVNCELTMEQVRDYFKSKITVAVSDTNFSVLVSDIIANNWIGEQSIYMMGWLICDTIIFGGEILGQDIDRMMVTISTYFNDPNSDWAQLCNNCIDPCVDISPQFETVVAGRGTYDVNTSTWKDQYYTDGGNNYRGIDIDFTPTLGDYDGRQYLHIDFDWTAGSGYSAGNLWLYVSYNNVFVHTEAYPNPANGTHSLCIDLGESNPDKRIRLIFRPSKNVNAGNVDITNIDLCINGTCQ